MFVLALLASAITTSIALAFTGFAFFTRQRSNNLSIKEESADLNELLDIDQWTTLTPEASVARMATTIQRSADIVRRVQDSIGSGATLNAQLTSNTLRAVLKAANAVASLEISIKNYKDDGDEVKIAKATDPCSSSPS